MLPTTNLTDDRRLQDLAEQAYLPEVLSTLKHKAIQYTGGAESPALSNFSGLAKLMKVSLGTAVLMVAAKQLQVVLDWYGDGYTFDPQLYQKREVPQRLVDLQAYLCLFHLVLDTSHRKVAHGPWLEDPTQADLWRSAEIRYLPEVLVSLGSVHPYSSPPAKEVLLSWWGVLLSWAQGDGELLLVPERVERTIAALSAALCAIRMRAEDSQKEVPC